MTWAIDFFTVTTINFATIYVFLVFEHGRRPVIHLATTRDPSMERVVQQLRNAMPFGSQPRYLFRDNDGIYGHGIARFLKSCGIGEVRTALQSPGQSPYIERFIGTLRRRAAQAAAPSPPGAYGKRSPRASPGVVTAGVGPVGHEVRSRMADHAAGGGSLQSGMVDLDEGA